MKKKLTLLLAVVMVVGCVLAIAPAADTTGGAGGITESYKPDIAYTNVNYVDDLVLMFAVPVPSALDEGSSVKLIVWDAQSDVFSYKNTVSTSTSLATAIAIDAEEGTTSIGGAEHYVFKYRGLTADMMTDVIYARAAVVDKDGNATAYGDVIDYSVVEYVETAKGGFNDGNPVIANTKVLELLDAILDFGAIAQDVFGGETAYMPNGYYANEELHKIWITPIVAGETKEKVFGGFFKYVEGGYATVREPFFDGFTLISYKDAEGNKLEDANVIGYDEALGFQLNAVDADIEIIVEYEADAFRALSASKFGSDFVLNNVTAITDTDVLKNTGLKYNNTTFSSIAITGVVRRLNYSGVAGVSKSYYHGIKTIPDPENPDNLVFMFTITNKPMMSFSFIKPEELVSAGYGDTLGEAITIEFEIGKPTPDSVVSTGIFSLNRRKEDNPTPDSYDDTVKNMEDTLNIFRVMRNKVYLMNGKSSDETKGQVICTLPDTGLTKIAITIYSTGVVKGYYSDEDGKMIEGASFELSMPDNYLTRREMHNANLNDDDPINDEDFLAYECFGNWLSTSILAPNWTLGIGANTQNDLEGYTDNLSELQRIAEENTKYSYILDDFKFCAGALYE